jgi:hypothetical protein
MSQAQWVQSAGKYPPFFPNAQRRLYKIASELLKKNYLMK